MRNQTIEGFRLSPQQKHLWLLQQDNFAYYTQCAIRLEGQINAELLKAALEKVVARHEILRTSFQRRPGIKFPIQVIGESSTIFWQDINLIGLSTEEQLDKIEALFEAERHFIFNFQASQLRLSLLKLSDKQHILLINLPSLYADSWSLKNLVQEISNAYTACLEGKELTDEPVQYIQFSEWQNELLEVEDAEVGKDFWQQSWELRSLTLPFERQQREKTKFEPDVYVVKIEPDVQKLEEIATLHSTTIDKFLFACWQLLIGRITGKSDVTITTVFNGRKYQELHQSLGLLAKSLPVRCSWQESLKFTEVLAQIDENWHNIDQWQEYFIWEDPALTTNVDFPISFEFDEWLDKYSAGGVSFSLDKHYVCFDRFKVKLTCLHQPESLTTQLHYDRELIDRQSIQRLGEQFQTLVASAAKNPEATVNELEIISDRQRQQILAINNTQIDYPQKCIHHLFEAQVEQTPHNIAVVFEDQHLTYRELNTRANQLAHYLQDLGVGAEELVGIDLERSLEIIIAMLGILKAGGAYLPIDPALPTEGLSFRLQDTQARVLLTQQSLVETVPNSATQVVCLDHSEVIAQKSKANPTSQVTSENLVYVLFTSGSTGEPKGVAVEHRQLLNYLYGILEKLNLPAGASYATVSTFAADLGNTAIFPALCTGGCLHIISSERASDPAALADYCDRHPIDCLKIVPSHLATLLASSSAILPRQRLVLGGEAASWELIHQIQQQSPCQILNHYGPTETTVGVLTYCVDQLSHAATVPLGRPLANTQVYVLDQQLRLVPIGVPGELYISGAGLARAYLHRPELTAERFINNPFEDGPRLYKTGDIARYLPDGNIEFLGRVDDQVKIRGFRVELGEIAALLNQHPGIRQASAIVREDVPGDQRLVAYLVLNRQSALDVGAIRSFLQTKLPEYMIPSAFVILQALPLTPNGKVDRSSLPAPDRTHSGLEAGYIAPRTAAEKQLTEIWAKVLGLKQVGIYDNFFELGGHSLLLTQLLVQVRDAFQVDLSLSSLFASSTVAELAEKIELAGRKDTQFDRETSLDLGAEVVLDPTIRPDTFSLQPSASCLDNAILLTGATGFLGAFLLSELLQQTTADIYCLVRSLNIESAKNKLQSSLESYLVWQESFSHRIIPVVGDLSQPLLGLSQEQFHFLASKIEAIYHNGAWVHHTSSYSTLKAANVLGTQEILRLASQIKLKPVHFISTTSVFSSSNSAEGKLREQDSLEHSPIDANGYVQSKWVAEKLITIAGDRGLPVSIYRPGRISGHSQTGVFNQNDFLYRLIIGCIQLGAAPAGNTNFDLVPVDYVSQAIIHLSKQQESLGKAFHLVNPRPLNANVLIDAIRSLGYPIERISYEQWRTELLNIARNFPEHPLYPLVPFFAASDSQQSNTSASRKRQASEAGIAFDCQNTLTGLANTGITCPQISDRLLHTYLSYLINKNFLNPPQPQQIPC
ncbi:MAG: amino acid adenylation domain-containing protein [Gloeocapsa sp. UFS-A4-WI-NPMV-4B04]|jgi:amino acid adenylation domain-containing protein/thioester reductase-like protein|nr:amino acid adenylation domain-containing protein [Gloeocapsa sp. UFS-A4-WI-NPMV-4B04]